MDFGKGTNRDDVSFYKKLARFEKSQRLGIPIEQYESLLRQHKVGKVVVKFNEEAAYADRDRHMSSSKKMPRGATVKTMTVSNPSVTYLSENEMNS